MALEGSSPRVTLGIATYNRDAYLREAVTSCLAQDHPSLEVLVVVDGTTNPRIDEVLAGCTDPRLRVVHHESNRGIAAAYNTIVAEGRGELIAMLGDDDLCLPGRIRRQVEIFDRFPGTGIVHGNATVIDEAGRRTGSWDSGELGPGELYRSLIRVHNHLIDPSRMVHRSVYDAVGGYDAAYPLANDFDFWLRAARVTRLRHLGGEPIVAVRRHGENTSDPSGRTREIDDVERAIEAAIERDGLRALVPELDWAVMTPAAGERRALGKLAELMEQRQLPLPGLAGRLRSRATAIPEPTRTLPSRGRLLMTSFGFNDSGGGTTVPRLAAKELARRGWDVTVFHAATRLLEGEPPYTIREWTEDGVNLVAVHNRPHGLFDLGHPDRELDDPPITAAFEELLDRVAPDVVHFHNLHNLGATLIDRVAARGIPAHFTPHNYWLICPRAYLIDGSGSICPGPGDGSACATCVGSADHDGHRRRLAEIRARAHRGLTSILAVSDAVHDALTGAGYSPELVDVVRQSMPHEAEIWETVGRDRAPGRCRERLTVAFIGSAYPHKGPQLLVEAAQRTHAEPAVRIYGEAPEPFARALRAADRRGVVSLEGGFAPSELPAILADVDAVVLPSLWWDCAPLVAAECLAARVPLIVPRLGGLPEAIRDGVDGLVFRAGNADDLAAQLERLAGEPGLLERLQSAIDAPGSFADYVDTLERCYAGQRPGRVAGGPVTRAPAVRWQGEHGRPTSLSIINDSISARLAGPVQRIGVNGGPGPDAPLSRPADVEVRHQWPPDLSPAPAGRLAVIQPWEFGAIPRDWIDPIRRNVDELWVPSEYVRAMYTAAGVPADRVLVIPNGVDLELFSPEGPVRERGPSTGTRFLFVGGLVWRKGPDLLFEAYTRAFAGREDVTLVIKDFGADGIYREGHRDHIRAHVAAGALPLIELIDEELTPDEISALYRSCDVFVTPYRGEGFAMPVLEAMACGLPVIATAGGPTDEFLPPEGGWRIPSRPRVLPVEPVPWLQTSGQPWVLEPDGAALMALMLEADAAGSAARTDRGRAGRRAAEELSWDAVAALYRERIAALTGRPPRAAQPDDVSASELEEDVAIRVLATPAWRGSDKLAELLAHWARATDPATSACLYLLSDPAVDGTPEALESCVLHAATDAGVDLDACADITILMRPATRERDRGLHAAVDVYIPIHDACAGHERMARAAQTRVLTPAQLGATQLMAVTTPIPTLAGTR